MIGEALWALILEQSSGDLINLARSGYPTAAEITNKQKFHDFHHYFEPSRVLGQREILKILTILKFWPNFDGCSIQSLSSKKFESASTLKKRNKDVKCIAVVTSFLRIFIIYLIVYICYPYSPSSFFEKISFQENAKFHKNILVNFWIHFFFWPNKDW